ncbi:hypothetical protein [Novosphingobium clariflavum]|uniref:Transposase n=1 Tax=Novosphingobium clariflavum TaxID=2029884 RepID=A0ABV6S8R5_9SPHN|nr:hypothetical protein [Novosphingobium clariflavum]
MRLSRQDEHRDTWQRTEQDYAKRAKSQIGKELLRQKTWEMHFDQTGLTHFRDFLRNLIA